MLKRFISVLYFVFVLLYIEGQNFVSGRVVDNMTYKPVAFANISVNGSNIGVMADELGYFKIKTNINDSISIRISCIGYNTQQKIIKSNNKTIEYFYLEQKIQTISELSVIAEEKESLETTSVIDKAALKHIQPTSFADLLELIPGGLAHNINMSYVQLISLREPVNASGSTSYDYNSSLGTAFVIDGIPLSNDAELQDVIGAYYNNSATFLNRTRTTGKGIDMRTISTDDIESVEIVRGIPSVKYGELTSGLVKINRAYKETDWKGRIKISPGTRLFAMGKGFKLFNDQILNLNVDYTYYMPDQRNLKVNYGRITGSARYKNNINVTNGIWTLKINGDYTGSFDETRIDPEIDHPETDTYDKRYNNIRLSSNLFYQSKNKGWFREFESLVSGSYTHNENDITKSVVSSYSPITNSLTEGEYYGEFLPASYIADYKNDGKPVYLNTSFNLLFIPVFWGVEQRITFGGDYRYEKNFGDGEVYDTSRPLYVGTGRPRASKDIPSIQQLAFFLEDNFTFYFGESKLDAQIGVRSNTALNISSTYYMDNKIFLDPRLNLAYSLPRIKLGTEDLLLTFTGGYGWMTKFPGLTHLYPNLYYIDKVEFNYYSSQKEDLRVIYYKTNIIDLTNFSLKPNRNSKIELGMRFKMGKYRLTINGYYEEMKRGFKNLGHIYYMTYNKYDIESGPSPSELTEPPTIDMYDYESKTMFVSYSMRGNGAYEEKKGIEYQLDLGRIETIQSRISINGAWMVFKSDLSEFNYIVPDVVIGDETYPYYGAYVWDWGRRYEQFNTNIRFDTQIEAMKLIFSTTIQNLWFTGSRNNYYEPTPEYYYDAQGNQYTFNDEDVNDPILKFLVDPRNDYSLDNFKNRRVPYEMEINFKVTKKIMKMMELSFYVNRLIYVAPDYENSYGVTIKREAFPYFGCELNINL